MRLTLIRPLLLSFLSLLTSLAPAAGDPRTAESAFRAGNRLFDATRFAEAVEMYTRALDQGPRNSKTYYNRALANEMVDRKAAIRDWKQFLELVGDNADWKAAASQVRERLQTLEGMPCLPGSLQFSRYSPKAGDYYQDVAQDSQGLQFRKFPVRVFAAGVPERWQRSTREGLDDWSRVVPLQELDSREGADIILTWQTSADQSGRLAWEKDWIEVQDNGTTVHRTKVSFVTLDNSRHLSTAQQRAAVLHEIGHALGIQGHSSRSEDVMCGTITLDVVRETRMVPGITSNYSLANVPPRSYVPAPPKDLTRRDVNTLIRLYNCPGYLTRLE